MTVVFVHGYFSSAASCWKSKSGVYWPELLLADPRLPEMSIFLGGYETGIDSGQYGIRDCANELFDSLQRRSPSHGASVLDGKNLTFVCHSLGGIVVRYMLEAYAERLSKHRIGLLLMASPSIGSEYAVSLSGLIGFYRNRVGLQLAFSSEILRDLDDRFRQYLDKSRLEKVSGCEAIEHKPLWQLKLVPWLRPIVEKESAARYFSFQRMIGGTNHSTIVKPDSIDHGTHG